MKFLFVFLLAATAACMVYAEQPQPETPKRVQRVDFRNLPLIDAARLLSEETGMNIVTSAEASKLPVSLYLRNVPAKAVIEELCKSYNLWYRHDAESGITRIMTVQEFQRDLVSVKEEATEVFTLLYPNSLPIAIAIRDLYGERVQLSTDSAENEESRDLQERFSRFDIVDQRSQGLGLFQGGGTSVFGGAGNNRFSGTTTEQVFGGGTIARRSDFAQREAQDGRDTTGEFKPLSAQQAQQLQKLLEAGANTPEAQQALAALRRQPADIYVTINRRKNMVIVRTSDQKTMQEIRELIRKLDVPTPTVLLEVKVLSVQLGDGFNSVFDYQFSDGVNNAGGFTTGDVLPPLTDVLSGVARRQAPISPAGTGLRSGDLTFQYVNNNFRARLQVLDTKNKITALATPLLMTANNEVSRLFVGEERPIIRNISSQTVVNENTTTSTPNTTVEFRPVGTTLLITPTINSDRTVTLRILQENSGINARAATIPVVTSDGALDEQPVDVVTTRTVSGTVIAKDDLTIAIGGLIEDSLNDQRGQVPVLGKIPVLGIPFRRQNTSRNRSELIVLIRPHILTTPQEAEAVSRKLMCDLSLHPKAPDAEGAMPTFKPREVLNPEPPENRKEAIFSLERVKNNDE
ncbi:MAG TPA: hypothetical protein VEJ63_24595 [Planctomycetota bacterium]|nr:hypothetical protein [Planctomycetota bacterium]